MKVVLTAFNGLLRSAVFSLPDEMAKQKTISIDVPYEKDVWDGKSIGNAVVSKSQLQTIRQVHFHPTETYRHLSDEYVREYELSCAVVTNDP